MPTYNRREFIAQSLKCYLSQDWTDKELIVVDDGEDVVEDLFLGIPGVTYYQVPKFETLGQKVNFCCECANGEIIATWDDDDWYAPNRLTDQAMRIIDSGKAVTGYSTMVFFDGSRASQYRGAPDYAVGNTQVYRKDFWEKNYFDFVNVGYDNGLVRRAREQKQIVCVPGEGMAVARIHGTNVTGRRGSIGDEKQWPWVSLDCLPKGFCRA